LIIDWIDKDMVVEPQIILKKLLIMITGSIPRSVASFAKEA
ncbi:TetR family transcriptional regulator, partial [Clostridium beijerinckii]|nr:TetR family transcriptional regulator [Clostridium beijerinckii]